MAFGRIRNLPPANLVYVGDRPAREMDLSIITYDAASAQMNKLANVDELTQFQSKSKISWINISGLKNIDAIKRLGEMYNIHLLTIEDILNTEQQPKVEIFDEYRFLSIKTLKNNEEGEFLSEQILIDQISIIIMKNVIITFQEISRGTFGGIRKKILEDIGKIRRMGMDYLAYSIIDAIVDEYLLTLNNLEETIEDFEERATKTSDNKFIGEIQATKKYILQIKRAIYPLKDNMITISHHQLFFRSEELKPYLQDLNEHLNQALSLAENHREWLTGIMDVNLSVLSHQTNKVMKVLAIISTIFIPLTFIAGIYGMNFEFMPELKHVYGYFVTLGGMGLIALIMVIIFKIHRWF